VRKISVDASSNLWVFYSINGKERKKNKERKKERKKEIKKERCVWGRVKIQVSSVPYFIHAKVWKSQERGITATEQGLVHQNSARGRLKPEKQTK
jgi:hypothetical protein